MVLTATIPEVLFAWWRKKKRRPARCWSSYLDLCISTQQKYGGVVEHLNNCAGVWRGAKGENKRPVGCGDRVQCPLCADYYHATLAREGITIIKALLTAAKAQGYGRVTWGERIELTLPKDISGYLDALFELNPAMARDKVNKLRQAAWRVVKKAVKRACFDADPDIEAVIGDCELADRLHFERPGARYLKGLLAVYPEPGELGAVMVVHHWGSSIPWLPHWHLHIYLAPYAVTDCVSSEVRDGDVALECGVKRHSCQGCPWSGRDGTGKRDDTRCFKLDCELEVVRVVSDGRRGEGVKLIRPKARKSHRVYSDKFSNWRGLPRWWSIEALAELRVSWKKAVERILGIKYPGDWDVNRNYLGRERKMLHTIAYQMRAPLRDIWKGVRSVRDSDGKVVPGAFAYWVKGKGKPGKLGYQPGKLIPMTVDDFEGAYGREKSVRLWLTRVTWYGYFSNVKQTSAMKSLDLELDEDEEGEGGKDGDKYWRPVDTTALGVLFEATDDSGDTDFVEWKRLFSEPVPASLEKPIGATRRRRWIARSPPTGGE